MSKHFVRQLKEKWYCKSIQQDQQPHPNPTSHQTPALVYAALCHALRINTAHLSIDLLSVNYWPCFDVILMPLYERCQIKLWKLWYISLLFRGIMRLQLNDSFHSVSHKLDYRFTTSPNLYTPHSWQNLELIFDFLLWS